MRNRLLCFMLIAISGCGGAVTPPVLPSSNLPTGEEKPLPLSITVTPKVIMSYTDARVTCRMPTDLKEHGQFIFGVDGMFRSEGPLDRVEYFRHIRVSCEPIHIYCGYQIYGENGWEKPVVTVLDVDVIGECL